MSIEFIEKYCHKNNNKKEKLTNELIGKLTHFYGNGKNLTKIGDLSLCINLKVLYLHNNKITAIENLINLKKLTHLHLQWNKLTKITNLNNLICLQKLYLANNHIELLENIAELKHLEELHIERQILDENVSFQFEQKSLEGISHSLRILNISNLQLESLDDIHPLFRLEILHATGNNFQCPDEIGQSLGNLPFLTVVNVHDCPAQKDIHYREKITAGAYQIATLDGKDICNNQRYFIKHLQQVKMDRSIKSGISDMSKKLQFEKEKQMSRKINQKNKSDTAFGERKARFSSHPSYSFGVATSNCTLDINEVGYKPWNSLKKPIACRTRSLHKTVRTSKHRVRPDCLLQGQNIHLMD